MPLIRRAERVSRVCGCVAARPRVPTSSPAICPAIPRRATTCCFGSWVPRTAGRSTASVVRTSLTSKVAVVSRSHAARRRRRLPVPAVGGRARRVAIEQNCGNILAGGRAVRRGDRAGRDRDSGTARVHMVNSGSLAVPPSHTRRSAGVRRRTCRSTESRAAAGARSPSPIPRVRPATGTLLPTGQVRDTVDGIDGQLRRQRHAGRLAHRRGLGLTGYETPRRAGRRRRTVATGRSTALRKAAD